MKHSNLLIFIFCTCANLLLSGQTLPLLFSFESPPEFDPNYFTPIPNLSGQNGLVDIANGTGANGTAYYVRMGKINDQGGETTNALNLKLDLSSYEGKQLELSFWFYSVGADAKYDNAIFMSSDGVSFKRVIALMSSPWCDYTWGKFQTFDLDALIAAHGFSYTANFTIQFRQIGDNDFGGVGDKDGIYLDEISIKEAAIIEYKTLPIVEGFGSGKLENHWTVKTASIGDFEALSDGTTPYPFASVVNAGAIDGDGYSLLLSKSGDCEVPNRNAVDLHINLAGKDNSELDFSFWFNDYDDDTDVSDGIWFSDDGGETFTEKPVIALQPGSWESYIYGRFQTFDLDSLIRKHSLAFSDQFVIRFQQEGTRDHTGVGQKDGIFFDAIQIVEIPKPIYQTIPFCDNFEVDTIFNKHWRLGYADLDNDGKPINGTTPSVLAGVTGTNNKALHLGKTNDHNGMTLSRADLHLNLAGATNVILSFDFHDHYNEFQAGDGIWISVDGGKTFGTEPFYIFDYANLPNNVFQNHPPLKIDSLAESKGLILTDKTILRFQQLGTGDFGSSAQSADGIIMDNLCLSGIISSHNEFSLPLEWKIYPNPAQDMLNLELQSLIYEELLLKVFDLAGYEVLSLLCKDFSDAVKISVDHLPQGIYFLRLQAPETGKFAVKKVVISRP